MLTGLEICQKMSTLLLIRKLEFRDLIMLVSALVLSYRKIWDIRLSLFFENQFDENFQSGRTKARLENHTIHRHFQGKWVLLFCCIVGYFGYGRIYFVALSTKADKIRYLDFVWKLMWKEIMIFCKMEEWRVNKVWPHF